MKRSSTEPTACSGGHESNQRGMRMYLQQEIPREEPPVKIRAIDLFCGAGGLTHGLKSQAGDAKSAMILHRSQKLSAVNMQRMKASKQGGTWRDWPRCLLAPCHALASGRTFLDVYGRMEWDKPSPTITTKFFGYGNGRFGHPDQDRAISLLEGAILQGFPEDYQFVTSGMKPCFRAVGRMIGNAVPPVLGELIGRSLIEHALKHA